MVKIDNINRRKFLELFTGCTCGMVITSCTTAPITERKQLKLLPESSINRQAAQLYERVKAKTKLSDDKKQLKEIKEIALHQCRQRWGPEAYIDQELIDAEGYVMHSDAGSWKLIYRQTFSHANFNNAKWCATS